MTGPDTHLDDRETQRARPETRMAESDTPGLTAFMPPCDASTGRIADRDQYASRSRSARRSAGRPENRVGEPTQLFKVR